MKNDVERSRTGYLIKDVYLPIKGIIIGSRYVYEANTRCLR